VLRQTDNEVLFSVTEQVRDATHFSIAEFDEPLRRAARGTEGILGLRRTILASEPDPNSDRFLLATIGTNASDIGWLCRENGLTSQRKVILLTAALTKASERDLQLLTQHESLSEEVEETLVEALPRTAAQLARMLMSENVPVGRLLRNGCRVLSLLEPGMKADLTLRMLTLGLSKADSSENRSLEELITESASFLDPHRVIAMAISWNATQQRVSDNVVLLNRATSKIRTGVLAEIDELTARLISRRHERISEEFVASWAQLLSDSGAINQRAQTNAAGGVLSFALEKRNKAVSPLIVVAFPIVYQELRSGKETPSLFSLFFPDWDRCKTARQNIVEAFLHSGWPTTDLIRAVEPTGDLGRVLKRVLRDRKGESFLMRLRRDVNKLSIEERAQMETAISKALNRQTKERDSSE
jgi:hypothetical protein